MSAEQMHATPLSEKNGVIGRLEADEDARTESSEGSNAQSQWTPEAGESEDEFEDAMEPPSSTSGMLSTFDGAAAPLSGVYEDAVEATDEQVLAAIVSTGSDGRQSTIQEEEEQEGENEDDMEDDVVAVVDGIVERVAVKYGEIAEEEVGVFVEEIADTQAETVTETLDGEIDEALHVIGEEGDAKEDVAEDEAASGAQAVEDAEVEERPETPEEEVAEADVDNELPEGPQVLADEQEAVPIDDELAEKSAAEESTTANPGIEEEAAEIVGELGDNTEESTPETPAVVEADKLEDGAVPDTTEEESNFVESIETDPGSDVDLVSGQSTMACKVQKDEDSAAQSIDQGVTASETRQSEAIEARILVEDSADESVVVNSVEGAAEVVAEKEIIDENPQEPTGIAEADASLLVDEKVAEVPCGPSAEEDALTTHSTEDAITEVEVVAQITDELVEAVLLEHDKTEHADEEDLEEKPAPDSASKEVATGENTPDDIVLQEDSEDNNVGAEGEQNPAEEEAIIPPASAAKDIDSYRKSNDDHPNSGVLLGLLPRLEPSSGATTTTTIEPFVLSSESNEMMEVHLPPQRWTYEVYGFSIEDRVVYYHIHRSDRRTGIREPPILKRYTDFRELQIQLFDTRLHAATDMPRIPRPHLGTVFRGYRSKKTIEIREKAFRALLLYISQYPALHGSAVFERFITTSRASTGAGWI